MKSSVKTIVPVLFLLILSCAANYFLQRSIITKGLHIKPETKYLVFGDSHAADDFNPAFISNMENFSNWGESVFFTYYKLKRLIENNPDKKDLGIILSFTYHTLYKDRENMYEPKQRPKIIQEYYSLLDNEGLNILKHEGTEFWLTKLKFDFGIPFNFKVNIEKFNKSFFNNGYTGSSGTHAVSVAHAQFKFKDHFDNEKNPQMSPMLLSYLDKIIELTKENNFKLILVNAPKYKYYREMVPQIVLTDFNKIVKQITSSNTNVVFYDFSSALNDSTLFYDTDHLNTNGAEKFSIKIDSCLKSLDKK